jgi:hemolysin activation/secretion protein
MNYQQIIIVVAIMGFTAGISVAQDFERYRPKNPNLREFSRRDSKDLDSKRVTPTDDRTLIRNLRGIIFSRVGTEIPRQMRHQITGIRTVDLPLLETKEFVDTMSVYLGKPVSLSTINDIKMQLAKYYRKRNYPIVTSVVPEQEVTHGVLNLVVIESRLGAVRVENERLPDWEPEGGWFNEKLFIKGIRTKPGELINFQHVAEDVHWMNRNQFRSVDVIYEQGEKLYTTDIVLKVTDVFPFRPYIGYENSGTKAVGEGRVFAGFNYGNLWGLDHQFEYQFTTKSDFDADEFQVHTMMYTLPVAKFHTVKLFGAIGSTDVEINDLFRVTSDSYQASLRYYYDIPPRVGNFTHKLELGYDFKDYGSDLEFGGQKININPNDPTPDENFQVAQLVFGYYGELLDKLGATNFGISMRYSPGGLAPNSKTRYLREQQPNVDIDVEYFTGVISLDRVTRMPFGMSLLLRGVYQFADSSLPYSERYGAGGFGTVRGYDERAASGDEGYNFTAELRSPSFTPLKYMGVDRLTDSLVLVGFFDRAETKILSPIVGDDKHVQMMSVGAGVRYNISGYLSSRFDYGYQLIGSKDALFRRLPKEWNPSYSVTLSWIF